MKNQTVILLIIAGACGLVAMMGVKQYLANQNHVEEVPKVQVLVAATDIKQGAPLSEINTQFVTVEAETCPEGVVTQLEQIEERALKVPRGAGDWIMVDQLTEKGQTGATAVIPKGMRVTTIPVDATTHHSGMLQPGNRIDLFLTYRDRDQVTGIQTQKIMPILEYIEVFAVDNVVYGVNSAGENMQARNISLLVTPEQMMKLQLAKKKGDITTSLRSNADKDSIAIAEMTEDNLDSTVGEKIDATSTLDVKGEFEEMEVADGGFTLPEPEPTPDISGLLQAELVKNGPGVTGPVMTQTTPDTGSEFWTMAIHESGGVRVEKVNLLSEEPVDSRSSASAAAAVPQQIETSAGNVPIPGTLPPAAAPTSDDDAKAGSDSDDSDVLEEAASGLLELFN